MADETARGAESGAPQTQPAAEQRSDSAANVVSTGAAVHRDLFRVDGHAPEAVYVYRSADGEPVGAAARFAPGTLESARKSIRQFRFENGGWVPGLNGISLPIYNLPEVRATIAANRAVFIVEGEKCCDRLMALGIVATTNSSGAGHWKPHHTEAVSGASIFILSDNDKPGRDHGLSVARAVHSVSRGVRLVGLPDLPLNGGDVADWLDAGGTAQNLIELAKACEQWTPPASVVDDWPEPVAFAVDSEPAPFNLREFQPPILCELASAIAENVKVDPTAPAFLIPAVISAAAGNAFTVRVSPSHFEPNTSRYSLWAKPSGERGSQTFRHINAPLNDWTAKARMLHRESNARIEAERKHHERKAEEAEAAALKSEDPDEVERHRGLAQLHREKIPRTKRRPMVFIGDVSPEQLVRFMDEQGGAFAVLSADARHVADAILGKYRKDGSTDDSVFLLAHGGDVIDRGRVGNSPGGEVICIPRPALATAICIQPDKLAHLAARIDLILSGFLPRFNIAAPRSLVGTRIETGDERPIDPMLAMCWDVINCSILDERFRIIESEGESAWKPVELVLAPDAMVRRRDFANEIEVRQAPGADLSTMSAFASKVAGEAARLAGLFHLAQMANLGRLREAGQVPISLATWTWAEQQQRWQMRETLRVLALAREDALTTKARRILAWCARGPEQRRTVAGRDLISSRIVSDLTEASDAMRLLVENGWAREIQLTGKPQSPRWEIHPRVFQGRSL